MTFSIACGRGVVPFLALTTALACPAASGALAATVANAGFSGTMTIAAGAHSKTVSPTKAGSFSVTQSTKTSSEIGGLIFSVSPAPGISVTATGQGPAKLSAFAAGTMTYYYQVVGPKAVAVPIIATGSGAIGGSTAKLTAAAVAEVVSNLGATKFPISASCPTAYPTSGVIKYAVLCGGYSNTVSFKATASTATSQAGANSILLLTTDHATGAGGASASVSVSLQVDPTFANASLYSIIVSKGLTNP